MSAPSWSAIDGRAFYRASLHICLFGLIALTSASCSGMVRNLPNLTAEQFPVATPTAAATAGIPDLGPELAIQQQSQPEPTVAPSPTPAPPAPTVAPILEAVVNTDALNIRGGPGSNFAVIGGLQRNDVLRVGETSPDGAWLRVTTANNPQGWVMSKFVIQRTAAPVTAAPPATQQVLAGVPASTPVPAPTPGLWLHVLTGKEVTPAQIVKISLENVVPFRIVERRNLSDGKRIRQGLWLVIPDSPAPVQIAATLAVVAMSHAQTPRVAGPQVVVIYAYKADDEIMQAKTPSVGWAQYAVDGRSWDGSQKIENGVQIQLSDGSNLLAIASAP